MAGQCLSAASIVPSNSRTCPRNSAESSVLLNGFPSLFASGSSFRGTKLPVEGRRPARFFVQKRHSTVATVLFSLPTAKPERESSEMLPNPEHPPLTEPAQRALDWAIDAKLQSGEDGEINPSHILLGIWSEKESAGHKILASMGFTDEQAEELAKSMDKDLRLSYK